MAVRESSIKSRRLMQKDRAAEIRRNDGDAAHGVSATAKTVPEFPSARAFAFEKHTEESTTEVGSTTTEGQGGVGKQYDPA
jgi:hypothetical protein